jgi:hypothetical protein
MYKKFNVIYSTQLETRGDAKNEKEKGTKETEREICKEDKSSKTVATAGGLGTVNHTSCIKISN